MKMLAGRNRAIAGGTALVLGAGVGLGGCQDVISAPGACPEFCPQREVVVIDSLFSGVVVADTTYRGYVAGHEATAIQLANPTAGAAGYGILLFEGYSDSIGVPGIPGLRPIVSVDSFRVRFTLRRRVPADSAVELGLHRLPLTVDTLTTFDDVAAFFDDSTLFATVPVPDTAAAGDTLEIVVASDSLPGFMSDGLRVAIGVALRASVEGFVELEAAESGSPPVVTAYLQADSGGTATYAIQQDRSPKLDMHVLTNVPPMPSVAFAVGGIPAARTFLSVSLPSDVADSAQVVRATLILIPAGPAVGAPNDTLTLRAEGLAADFGPKSPFNPTQSGGAALVPAGSADTVRIDVTNILGTWRTDSLAPRVIMLRVVREAATLGEFRVVATDSVEAAPRLHITYVPLELGGA